MKAPELEEVSNELQQALNSLEIMCNDDSDVDTIFHEMYVAKNHCRNALFKLKEEMGSDFKYFYGNPVSG